MYQKPQNQVDRKRIELINCAILHFKDDEINLFEQFVQDLEEDICQRFQSVLEDYYDFKADSLVEGYQEFIYNVCYAPDIEVETLHARVFGS